MKGEGKERKEEAGCKCLRLTNERGLAVATLEEPVWLSQPGVGPYVAVGHRAGPAPAATCPRPSRSAQPARAPLTHDDHAGPEGHKDPGVEQRQPRHGSSDGGGRIGGT